MQREKAPRWMTDGRGEVPSKTFRAVTEEFGEPKGTPEWSLHLKAFLQRLVGPHWSETGKPILLVRLQAGIQEGEAAILSCRQHSSADSVVTSKGGRPCVSASPRSAAETVSTSGERWQARQQHEIMHRWAHPGTLQQQQSLGEASGSRSFPVNHKETLLQFYWERQQPSRWGKLPKRN